MGTLPFVVKHLPKNRTAIPIDLFPLSKIDILTLKVTCGQVFVQETFQFFFPWKSLKQRSP